MTSPSPRLDDILREVEEEFSVDMDDYDMDALLRDTQEDLFVPDLVPDPVSAHSLLVEDILQEQDQDSSVSRSSTVSPSPPRASLPHIRPLSTERFSSSTPSASLVLFSQLSTMASFLHSARLHSGAGRVLCVVTHTKYIATGTSSGYVFVFDHFQNHLLTIPPLSDATDPGVSVLAVAPNSSFMALGTERGDLAIYSLTERRMLKHASRCMSSAVTNLVILEEDRPRVLLSDAVGRIAVLTLSKFLFSYTFERFELRRKTAGRVVTAVSAALPNPELPHPLDSSGLFAYATLDAVSVDTGALTGRRTHVEDFARPADVTKEATACLQWRPVSHAEVQSGKLGGASHAEQDLAGHPVLAVAWGPQIWIRALIPYGQCRSSVDVSDRVIALGTPISKPLAEYRVPDTSRILSLEWIGSSLLAVLPDKVLVLHPLSGEVLETHAMECATVNFHQHVLLPAPAVSGKESAQEIVACESVSSYSTSISAASNSLVILGLSAENRLLVFEARLRSWMERINVFVDSGHWLAALNLGLSFHGGVGGADLPRPTVLLDKLLLLGLRYVETVLRDYSPVRVSDSQLRELAATAIEYCTELSSPGFLYSQIFPRFTSLGIQHFFHQVLREFVLSGSITIITSAALDSYFEYYASISRITLAQETVYLLDHTRLDIKHAITLSRTLALHDLTLYLHTHALLDYTGVLAQLLDTAAVSPDPSPILHSVLAFLRACFSSMHFPTGVPMHPTMAAHVQGNLLVLLFPKANFSAAATTPLTVLLTHACAQVLEVLHLAFAQPVWLNLLAPERDPSPPPPNPEPSDALSSLTRQFGSMFSTTMETPETPPSIHSPVERIPLPASDAIPHPPALYTVPVLQDITDFLIFVTKESFPVASTQARELMLFLVPHLASSTITVGEDTLEEIYSTLLSLPDSPAEALRNQDALVTLLDLHPPSDTHRMFLHTRAEALGFTRVSRHLFMLASDYVSAFHTFLSGPDDLSLVFDFLQQALADRSLRLSAVSDLRAVVLEHIKVLVECDSTRAVELVVSHFAAETPRVSGVLAETPHLQLAYLEAIVQGSSDISNDATVNEDFIKLLCQFRPAKVYQHLVSHSNYRIDTAMAYCKEYGISDAAAYLLERTGDLKGALSLLCKKLSMAIATVMAQNGVRAGPSDGERLVDAAITEIIRLCDRSSERDPQDGRKLWFAVLDLLINLHKQYSSDSSNSTRVQENGTGNSSQVENPAKAEETPLKRILLGTLTTFLDAMLKYESGEAVLSILAEANSHLRFSELQSTIVAMLESNSADVAILESAIRVFQTDLVNSRATLCSEQASGFVLRSYDCVLCSNPISEVYSNSSVVVFACGHAYHDTCLGQLEDSCYVCFNNVPREEHMTRPEKHEPETPSFDSRAALVRRVAKIQKLVQPRESIYERFHGYIDTGHFT